MCGKCGQMMNAALQMTKASMGLTPSIPASTARKSLYNGIIGITKSKLGIGSATIEVIEERMLICSNCEYSTKNPNSNKGWMNKRCCGGCNGLPIGVPGCFIQEKTQLLTETCPQKRWAR